MPFLKNSFYFNRTDFFFPLHPSSEIHSRYRQNSALIKVQTENFFWTCTRIHFCQSGLWFRTSSVPGLVLVVPSVEIVVEEDDAPRRHAGNDAPEG